MDPVTLLEKLKTIAKSLSSLLTNTTYLLTHIYFILHNFCPIFFISWCRPFPKFLCIKGIVFVTFWQGLVISILASTSVTGRGSGHAGEDPNISGRQAQNFLICLEMLLFSIFHFHCFPTEEWQENYQPSQLKDTQFGDNIALRDFFSDLKVMMNSRKK